MIFDRLSSVILHGKSGNRIVVDAPNGCHLRVTDNAFGRLKCEGDVVRVEEIQDGKVNVGADYLHSVLAAYETR